MGEKLRAAVFSRESKGKTTSIDDQDRENLEAARELNATVITTLRDVVGASRFSGKARVGWPEVTALVDDGQIDLLIVWEVARADRVMDTWVPFVTAMAANGVLFHITSLEMTYDPRKAAHRKALLDMGSSAEQETGVLSERSRKGIRGALLDGKPHGRVPYGYDRQIGPTYTRNDNAPVVVEIITRLSQRHPVNQILKDLNDRGALSPSGGPWRRASLMYVAKNPAYIGKILRDGELHDGNWPPISDAPDWEATFWRCQALLSAPDRKYVRPGKLKYLLSYVANPGGCKHGGRFSMQNRENRALRYKCDHDSCVSVPAAELETYVVELVMERLSRPDARQLFARSGGDLAAAEAELARLERSLEDARQAYDDDVISAVALGRKEKRLLPDIEAAQKRVQEARRADVVLDLLGDGEFSESVVRKRWEALVLPAKRAVLNALFESITVWPVPYVIEKRVLDRWASDEERMDLTICRTVVKWRGQS